MNFSLERRYWGYFGLAVSISIIYVATISPFNFTMPQDLSWKSIIEGFRFGSSLKDYWQNILLFIPFGFSVAIVIHAWQKSLWKIILLSLLVSFLLTSSVELTQSFLPSRVSNFTDIIYNTLGGFSGGIIYSLRQKIVYFLAAIITGHIDRLSYSFLFVVIIIYCLAIVLGISVLSLSVNFSNWDDSYYLSVGNEVTGNRPWDGYMRNLYISDRSLNRQEIKAALTNSDRFFDEDPNSIASFKLDRDRQLYGDKNQQLPNLTWQNKSIVEAPPKPAKSSPKPIENVCLNRSQPITDSIRLNAKHWLKTQVPATTMSQRLKARSEFAIATTFASNNLNQGGPARIFSLAKNVYTQNIILGQRKQDLYFRLRTPTTGRNATDPEFYISNAIDDCLLHSILIEFKNNRLNFYLDSIDNKYSFAFNSFNNYPIFIPWNHRGRQIDLNNFDRTRQKINFYSITLIPLGLLFLLPLWKYKMSNE